MGAEEPLQAAHFYRSFVYRTMHAHQAAMVVPGMLSHGRHCHSTRSLVVIGCHPFGIYTVILLSLLSFSVKMTVPASSTPAAKAFSA